MKMKRLALDVGRLERKLYVHAYADIPKREFSKKMQKVDKEINAKTYKVLKAAN